MQQALDMHVSASLVRALASLDLYLKYLATFGDFLIIDEPEMNAHPEAQIAITEFLALLANAGLNVTVTTHSPYIVDHLNNLVEAARLPEAAQEAMQARFKLGTKGAFLDPEKLAVYFFSEDGQVRDAFNRETLSLDWSTFGKQSDYLSELYNELLQAGVGVR
jgi:predicted ATPase